MSTFAEDIAVLVAVLFVMVASFVVPWPLGIIVVLVMMPMTVNRVLDRRALAKRRAFAVTDEVLKDQGPDVIMQIQRQRLGEFLAGEKL